VIESPAWSPDGSRITYSVKTTGAADCVLSDYNIYVTDPNGGSKVKLTEGCGGRNTGASWSPDGSKIVFESRRDAPQDINTSLRDIEIYVMDSDGTDQTRLTYDAGYNDLLPTWATGGDEILFVQSRPLGEGGKSSLWRMNSDGTEQTLVRQFDEGLISSLALHHDGTSALLSISGNDRTDLYIMDLQTLTLSQVTDRVGSDYGGSWRPPTN
jgi:TolB protein